MATLDQVATIALSLPGAEERPVHGQRAWRVRDKLFVWERPLRRGDLAELGLEEQEGTVLGARVEHLIAKDALLASDPEVFFTTSHFDGNPSVLVRLDRVGPELLEEIVVEAWLVRAAPKVAEAWLAERAQGQIDPQHAEHAKRAERSG